jgi:hemolysin activation/secretion protein
MLCLLKRVLWRVCLLVFGVSRIVSDVFKYRSMNLGAAGHAGVALRMAAKVQAGLLGSVCVAVLCGVPAWASSPSSSSLTISEYTVEGNHLLSEDEIDDAVYPYLGPGQTIHSVDEARAALQKIYADKGYQTVEVLIPPQHVHDGVVTLKVVEGKIGRLDVNGAHYFSLNEIKSEAPSLAPGTVPNFKKVTKDIVALNSWQDRQVTPVLKAGKAPGTVDVDLNVKDQSPLHASIGLDNRYSADTTPLRLDASLSYDNLWQRGDSISLAYEVAPQRSADAEVFSGSYLARTNADWASILLYGLVSNSDVSTVGTTNVVGKGHVIGVRGIFTLPGGSGFFDTLSAGIDYKHFDQDVSLGDQHLPAPVTYFPITATYSATWQGGNGGSTQFDISPTFDLRGIGSSGITAFDAKRYDAEGNFFYVKADLSRTQPLPYGFQIFGKAQGQIANEPLVNSEQFSGGGQDTVRGYLESEVLGDNAILGSLELRTPSLATLMPASIAPKIDDWRFFTWAEGGQLNILDPLSEQQSVFNLASIGVGTRIKLVNHLNGMVDLAVPLVSSVDTKARDPRVEFHVWVEF